MPNGTGGDPVKSVAAKGSTMKKEELTALNVPEEAIPEIQKLVGRDIEAAKAAKDKEIEKITAERDNLQTQLTAANETLKGLDGKTPEQLKQEVADYQKKAEDAQKDFDAKILDRDQIAWLKGQFGPGEGQYNVTSAFSRDALIAAARADGSGLVWKDGQYVGFPAFMEAAKKKDSSLYQTAEEKAEAEKAREQQEKAPYFTGRAGNHTQEGAKYVPPKIF